MADGLGAWRVRWFPRALAVELGIGVAMAPPSCRHASAHCRTWTNSTDSLTLTLSQPISLGVYLILLAMTMVAVAACLTWVVGEVLGTIDDQRQRRGAAWTFVVAMAVLWRKKRPRWCRPSTPSIASARLDRLCSCTSKPSSSSSAKNAELSNPKRSSRTSVRGYASSRMMKMSGRLSEAELCAAPRGRRSSIVLAMAPSLIPTTVMPIRRNTVRLLPAFDTVFGLGNRWCRFQR
jgi:hypothetical protein